MGIRKVSRRLRTFAETHIDASALSMPDDDPEREATQLLELIEQLFGERSADWSRLVDAVDVIESGLVILDADGVERLRNAPARVFLDARHGELLAEREVAAAAERARLGETTQLDLEIMGPPRRTLAIAARPLVDSSATLVGVVVVLDDVTERRRLDAVRRDFVANIGHELKTPVGAIGLLAETIDSEDDPEVIRRLSTRIRVESTRVSALVEDLLSLAEVETADTRLHDEVDLLDVVHDAVDRMRAAAEFAGITIDVEIDGTDRFVRGSNRQLTSAVKNLLDNAVKYSDPGSHITVRLICLPHDASVRLEVSDTGIGIPARDLSRVFERFYRVDRARNRQTGGAGLGLAIVRHVVVNHGGTIDVDSVEGQGTTFVLHLPIAIPSRLPTEEPVRHG